ncbi:MAG: DUF433 domain-containing protein [Chthoniobacteraceae bacterium]
MKLAREADSLKVEAVMQPNDYIETRETGWWLRGSRVSLDSIIYAFRGGNSPEAIAYDCFPTLTLEQVYGAITCYLANRDELDAHLEDWKSRGENFGERWRAA